MNRDRRLGFSLVELLVVMAIIAIVAGIIVPVYMGARRKALETSCSANLRQLAAAWNAYLSDHGAAPPRIVSMIDGGYVPDRSILACPADPSTWGYGGETERLVAENDGVDPDSVRPFCVSYAYDPMWQFDEATHLIPTVIWTRYPDGGLFGCSFHGTPMERDPGTYTGLVLRVRADGSIVRDHIDHPPGAHAPSLVLYGNDFRYDLLEPEFGQGH